MRTISSLVFGLAATIATAATAATAEAQEADPAIAVCARYASKHVFAEPLHWEATSVQFAGASVTIDYSLGYDASHTVSHTCRFALEDGKFRLVASTQAAKDCHGQAGADCAVTIEKTDEAQARADDAAALLSAVGLYPIAPADTRLTAD